VAGCILSKVIRHFVTVNQDVRGGFYHTFLTGKKTMGF